MICKVCYSDFWSKHLSVHVIFLAVFKHSLFVAALTSFVAGQKLKPMMKNSHIRLMNEMQLMQQISEYDRVVAYCK